MATFEIRRGADRARTSTEWLDSAHSFAFGSHYDPDNLGFGALQACNEDTLQPGPGYPVHAHRDVEILTWVLAGSLTQLAEGGEPTVLVSGDLHHVSAGSGIRHTEFSSLPGEPVHLVQMWLRPDTGGTPPRTCRLAAGARLAGGGWVPLASGSADPAEPDVLRIQQQAALSAARLPAGATLALPVAPLVHLFVTTGLVTVEGRDELAAGDALRVTGEPAQPAVLTALEPAELLVWQLPDDATAVPSG